MTGSLSTQTAPADLGAIIKAYHEVTERLKRSHELLRREVHQLRTQLREKNRELQRRERLAALGEMAAGVAHEIRNPLAGIGLYSSLLDRDLADRPKEQQVVRKIWAGVRNLESIVSDILAFAGGAEPQLRQVPLSGIVERVIAQSAAQAEEHGAVVWVDPKLAAVELSCDARQIERALLNLTLNAVEMSERGGRVWIRQGREPADERLFPLAVEDNGPGIGEEHLERVFNPFFSTKESGTGLGLAIVHRIAEAGGGRVTAGNRPEGGAIFTLLIPVADSPARSRCHTDSPAKSLCHTGGRG